MTLQTCSTSSSSNTRNSASASSPWLLTMYAAASCVKPNRTKAFRHASASAMAHYNALPFTCPCKRPVVACLHNSFTCLRELQYVGLSSPTSTGACFPSLCFAKLVSLSIVAFTKLFYQDCEKLQSGWSNASLASDSFASPDAISLTILHADARCCPITTHTPHDTAGKMPSLQMSRWVTIVMSRHFLSRSFPIQGVKLYHLTDCLAPLCLCAKGSSGMLLKHRDPGDCDSVTVSLFYAVHRLRQVCYGSRWRSFQLHRIIERFPSYLGQYWSNFAHFWTSPAFIPTKSQQSSDFVGLRSYGTDLSIIRSKMIANAHASAVTPVSNSCHKEHCVCTVASSHTQHDAL